MFNEFGALYVLAPVGFLLAPRRLRRLALVSLPIAALFGIRAAARSRVVEFSFSRSAAGRAWCSSARRRSAAATLAAFARRQSARRRPVADRADRTMVARRLRCSSGHRDHRGPRCALRAVSTRSSTFTSAHNSHRDQGARCGAPRRRAGDCSSAYGRRRSGCSRAGRAPWRRQYLGIPRPRASSKRADRATDRCRGRRSGVRMGRGSVRDAGACTSANSWPCADSLYRDVRTAS